MANRRRSERFSVSLPIWLKDATGGERTRAIDVSSHGLAVVSTRPRPLRQYVELEMTLDQPRVTIGVTATVARHAELVDPHTGARVTGLGLDFFLFDGRAKTSWQQFLEYLRTSGPSKPVSPPLVVPPVEAPAPVRPSSPLPAPLPPPRALEPDEELPTFIIKPRDLGRLWAFFRGELTKGRVRIETPMPKRVGTPVELLVVHPSSEAEWSLPGQVTKAVEHTRGGRPVLEIGLAHLDEELRAAFRGFISTGRGMIEEEVPLSLEVAQGALAIAEAVGAAPRSLALAPPPERPAPAPVDLDAEEEREPTVIAEAMMAEPPLPLIRRASQLLASEARGVERIPSVVVDLDRLDELDEALAAGLFDGPTRAAEPSELERAEPEAASRGSSVFASFFAEAAAAAHDEAASFSDVEATVSEDNAGVPSLSEVARAFDGLKPGEPGAGAAFGPPPPEAITHEAGGDDLPTQAQLEASSGIERPGWVQLPPPPPPLMPSGSAERARPPEPQPAAEEEGEEPIPLTNPVRRAAPASAPAGAGPANGRPPGLPEWVVLRSKAEPAVAPVASVRPAPAPVPTAPSAPLSPSAVRSSPASTSEPADARPPPEPAPRGPGTERALFVLDASGELRPVAAEAPPAPPAAEASPRVVPLTRPKRVRSSAGVSVTAAQEVSPPSISVRGQPAAQEAPPRARSIPPPTPADAAEPPPIRVLRGAPLPAPPVPQGPTELHYRPAEDESQNPPMPPGTLFDFSELEALDAAAAAQPAAAPRQAAPPLSPGPPAPPAPKRSPQRNTVEREVAAAHKDLSTAGSNPHLDRDIALARARVVRSPNSATACYRLGALLVQRGDRGFLEEALDSLRKVMSLEPNHPAAHHKLAEVLARRGEYALAAEHLSRARRLGYRVDPDIERVVLEGAKGGEGS